MEWDMMRLRRKVLARLARQQRGPLNERELREAEISFLVKRMTRYLERTAYVAMAVDRIIRESNTIESCRDKATHAHINVLIKQILRYFKRLQNKLDIMSELIRMLPDSDEEEEDEDSDD